MNNYIDIRQNIKTGDLFFTAANAFFSRIIRFFTHSKVSHVGMFVWIGKRLFIVESIEGVGVRILPASEYIKINQKIWWGRVPHRFSEKEVEARIFNNDDNLPKIGGKYDMRGALLSKFFDTKSKETYCNEYVEKILDLKFFAYTNGRTPRDIATKAEFFIQIQW